VQHQLRAHTPNDAKSLRATVRTYPKSGYDLEQVLTQLATGEAIITVMNEKGAPSPVAWTRLRAPQGSMDPTPQTEIEAAVSASPLMAKYGTPVDPESAYEILAKKINEAAEADRAAEEAKANSSARDREADQLERDIRERDTTSRTPRTRTKAKQDKSLIEQIATSRTGKTVIREVVRSVFGSLKKRR